MKTAKPIRLQLSRRKGFNLQAHSRAVNGLPAVNCARPGPWSNPFKVGMHGPGYTLESAVADFTCGLLYERAAYHAGWPVKDFHFAAIAKNLAGLRGKNLACWCRPDDPCHCDILLELANDH